MLALLGFLTIIILLATIIMKKLSPVVALVLIPSIVAVFGGFGSKLGEFIISGVKGIAPVGTMFIFAILFFGVLTDAGMFDPIIKRILKAAGNDPVKIVVGSAVLAMLVHLDGSGAVTFLITIPAMLPLYNKLGMDKRILATVVALSAGTMNVLPWGGPTLRAASALEVPVTQLFNPVLPAFICGLLFVLFIAYRLGKKEKARLGHLEDVDINTDVGVQKNIDKEKQKLLRPKMFYFNVILTVVSILVLITGKLPPAVIFMFAFALALVINYPNVKEQRERVDAHAKAALMMASILFAAGAFVGIMKGSGMIKAMATAAVSVIPNSLGSHIPLVTGLVSMPASLLFDPDSFYFGVLPVLSAAAKGFGIPAVEVGRAAILGQMTTGFPVSPLTGSTFLLIGLTGVDLGEHQKRTIPYAFATTIVMVLVAVVTGVITL
ncbi:MAG: citrate-Mg2+:H+ or citrate-Ca2+:H+ symporter, CitMHS family [Thermosediminibacterales bacterium]|nr:citrate-Mg2+:H+ or citrate-Ca2+:H+ symporter, CitMHS family [Thermosediminibacterales bacterium]MDK2836646.1 citrate-Mg2+:H+ or citrate-Ca2+:H+ symporter, CitMHS family [Thermosediminibacterales bacterium]